MERVVETDKIPSLIDVGAALRCWCTPICCFSFKRARLYTEGRRFGGSFVSLLKLHPTYFINGSMASRNHATALLLGADFSMFELQHRWW